jgi:hypothetical protein
LLKEVGGYLTRPIFVWWRFEPSIVPLEVLDDLLRFGETLAVGRFNKDFFTTVLVT